MPKTIDDYLHRNLMVARAYGVTGGVDKALARLGQTKRPPRWLMGLLTDIAQRAAPLPAELVAHRDEIVVRYPTQERTV